jgi:hypothetical protein
VCAALARVLSRCGGARSILTCVRVHLLQVGHVERANAEPEKK